MASRPSHAAATPPKRGFWSRLFGSAAPQEPERQESLNRCRARFLAAHASPSLPTPLRTVVDTLALQCAALADALVDLQDEAESFLPRLEEHSSALAHLTESPTRRPWNAHTADLYVQLTELSAGMAFVLDEHARAQALSGTVRNADRFAATAAVREALIALGHQKTFLPEPLAVHIDAMDATAERILVWTERNPEKCRPALRFMRRYLEGANTMLDEYVRLVQSGITGNRLADTESAVAAMLPKLQGAFAEEYQALLKNDCLHFSAALRTLDVLLRLEKRVCP